VDSNLSFASSVRDYSYENGRRYHAYRHGQYPFPNDEEEQARLALMHHLFKLLSGGDLYRAPLTRNNNPSRILDIGTGTAEWAIEMAEDFPSTTILGTDLSPIQPSWAPPNCRFFIDDAESDWAFSPAEAFDYIHARSLGGGIADWPRLLRQAYTHLKPGGWFEAQEFETWVLSDDGTHTTASSILDWQDRLNEASTQFGKPMNVASRLEEWLMDAGFVNVVDDKYKVSTS
jgi:trans-aconitate methyltransferase